MRTFSWASLYPPHFHALPTLLYSKVHSTCTAAWQHAVGEEWGWCQSTHCWRSLPRLQLLLREHLCQEGIGAGAQHLLGIAEEEVVVLVHKPSDGIHHVTSVVLQFELLQGK